MISLAGCAAITRTGVAPEEAGRNGATNGPIAREEKAPRENLLRDPQSYQATSLLVERMVRALPPDLRLRYEEEHLEEDNHRRGTPLVARTGTHTLLGLADRLGDGELSVVYGDFSGSDTLPEIRAWPMQVNCGVTSFHPVAMTSRETHHFDGFEARLSCPDRDQSVFVFRRHPAAEEGPFILSAPTSTMERTVLRDLSGDGSPELLRYTWVFESRGRRELLLEAYRWTGETIRLVSSMSVLRHANSALDQLEKRLLDAGATNAHLDDILEPRDDAPPASSLPPLEMVRIPRFFNLPLQLGLPRWHIDHEIALEENIYRIRLHIQANPLTPNPVTIARRNTH